MKQASTKKHIESKAIKEMGEKRETEEIENRQRRIN